MKQTEKGKDKCKAPSKGVDKVHSGVYYADLQKISPISKAIKKNSKASSSSSSSPLRKGTKTLNPDDYDC
jgi:hypothetical protein